MSATLLQMMAMGFTPSGGGGGTVLFRDSSSVSLGGATGNLPKPTLLQSGDVQLVFIVGDTAGAQTITGGATWNQIGTQQNITNGDGGAFSLWYQVAGASEPTNYTVTGSGDPAVVAMSLAYSGANATTPIAAQLAYNPNSASVPNSPVSIPLSAITTTAASQMVVAFYMVDWNSASTSTFTDPTTLPTFNRRQAQNGTSFANGMGGDFVQATTGTTGTITAIGIQVGAGGNPGGWLIALQ